MIDRTKKDVRRITFSNNKPTAKRTEIHYISTLNIKNDKRKPSKAGKEHKAL